MASPSSVYTSAISSASTGTSSSVVEDPWLKEDGYLNVDVATKHIVYHPHLNVILIFTKTGDVKVLDVNSGVILQSCHLSGKRVQGTPNN